MLKRQFLEFQERFRADPLYVAMAAVFEDSPWHREPSVAKHTDMVVDQYLKAAPSSWTRQDWYGAYATLFHDVGKPAARTEKESEARGIYYSYPGHELVSARLFEDYATTHLTEHMSPLDIYCISWMIQTHLPWSIKDRVKLTNIRHTSNFIGANVFSAAMLADQQGRISDNYDYNLEKSKQWLTELETYPTVDYCVSQVHASQLISQPNVDLSVGKVVFMPIAASGTGKSTAISFVRSNIRDIDVYSFDALRLEWYNTSDYEHAFNQSCADPTFESRSQAHMINTLRHSDSVYIDNTNLSVKRRRFVIDNARRLGFTVVAITMPVPLDLITKRQHTRGDKNIPSNAVRNMYMSLTLPTLGEVDAILTTPLSGSFKS